MVKDRLKALQVAREALEAAGEVPQINEPYVYDHHIDLEEDENDEDSLHKFFAMVSEVRTWITTTEEHTREMRRLQSTILSSPRPDERSKMELEDRMAAVKITGNKVRNALKELAASIERSERKANGRPNASLRMRHTQYNGVSHLFSETLVAYNSSQLEYRERCKERIQRQLLIANKHTTDDELEDMLETGNVAVFTGDIVVQTQEARQALADIEARHHEIITLEKNISELRDLFIEMAGLVAAQGVMIDNIEKHVIGASEHVEGATKMTKKAVLYQSKARKKLLIIIMVVLILLLILALIIYFSIPKGP